MLTTSRYETDAAESREWDAALRQFDGDLLQSWRWGEFKRLHGWHVDRIRIERPGGVAMGQVLFRSYGPVSIAYLPRGPFITANGVVIREFLSSLDEACAARRAVMAVVEPRDPLPARWTSTGSGFVTGPNPFQTASTVKVRLAEDAELLAGMRKDTRSNILQARRRGVSVERAAVTPETVDAFYHLLRETSHRSGFGIHRRAYYSDFLRVFGEQAVLLFSRSDGRVTAGLIAARHGSEGRSMYAGSSSHRGRGDTALLRLEAMGWAREHGASRYDLGGIDTGVSAGAAHADSAHGPRQPDLTGVRQFKTGFGGEVVAYPATMERRYRPAMAWLLRRLYPRYREVPQRSEGGGFPAGLSFPVA